MRLDIFDALKEKDILKCLLLLEDRSNLYIRDTRDLHKTILMAACHSDQLEDVVDRMIELGVDVKAKDDDMQTALYYAVIHEQKQYVDTLLSAGANIDDEDNRGRSPLCWAITLESCSMIKLLIARGANVNIVTHSTYTPLHLAAFQGSVYGAKILLEAGASAEIKTASGKTAYDLAKGNRHSECAFYIAKYMDNVD